MESQKTITKSAQKQNEEVTIAMKVLEARNKALLKQNEMLILEEKKKSNLMFGLEQQLNLSRDNLERSIQDNRSLKQSNEYISKKLGEKEKLSVKN